MKDRELFFEDEATNNGRTEKVLFVIVIIGVIAICFVAMGIMAIGMKEGSGREEGLTFGLLGIGLIVGLYLIAKFSDKKAKRR